VRILDEGITLRLKSAIRRASLTGTNKRANQKNLTS